MHVVRRGYLADGAGGGRQVGGVRGENVAVVVGDPVGEILHDRHQWIVVPVGGWDRELLAQVSEQMWIVAYVVPGGGSDVKAPALKVR